MEKLWPVSVSLNRKELNAERLAEFALAGVRHIEFTGSEIADFEDFLRDPRAVYDPAANNGIKIRSVHLPFYRLRKSIWLRECGGRKPIS
ncbi:MAG: hypothetical protein ACLR56_08215 [Oscillospiraceae bacterium]